MTIEATQNLVERAYDAAYAGVQTAKEHDRMITARNANGRTVTFASNGRYNNPQCEDEAASVVHMEKDRALNAIRAAMGKRERELTESPSAETVSFLASIQNRDDLSQDEIAAALEHHGKTHAAQKSILAAAKRSGIYLADTRTKTERDIAALRVLEEQVNSAFVPWKVSTADAGKAWFTKAGFRGAL